MASSPKSTKGKTAPRPKERLTVRLSRPLIATLRRWATKEQAPVSTLVEEAVAQLCADLQHEQALRSQKAKARRKA
jgi:hypothetical protein